MSKERRMNGVELIAAERERQVSQEGWTPEHDDEHNEAEMVGAAIAYAREGALVETVAQGYNGIPRTWPDTWDTSWWKPSTDPIRNLVKAGALIAAEIDRLQRAGEDKEPTRK